MSVEVVTIGTRLLEISPYRDKRSPPPTEYEVVGETRVSWVARSRCGSEVKIDKETMLERGKSERRSLYMTPAAYEHQCRSPRLGSDSVRYSTRIHIDDERGGSSIFRAPHGAGSALDAERLVKRPAALLLVRRGPRGLACVDDVERLRARLADLHTDLASGRL